MSDEQPIEVKRYINQVMANIHGPAPERERIEADLRAHFQEAMERGEPAQAIIERMGSPTEVAAEFMSQMPIKYANFWWRLGAFCVDILLLVLVVAILTPPGILLFNLVPQHPVGADWVVGAIILALFTGLALAALGIFLLYFPILEARFGQTVGKRLFGLRVLKENGLPIGYKEAFLRRLSFYFEILPVDALFIPFSAKRQRAFDQIAGTVVIRETEDKRMRPLLVVALIVGLPLALMCSCIRLPSGSTPSATKLAPAHAASNFQSFTGVQRLNVPGAGGKSLVLEYQALLNRGSLSIQAENPQGGVVWQAAVPAGGTSTHDTTNIPMNQSGDYIIVVQGQAAEGTLDLSWRFQ